ncbi:DegT/DnrJ/EryC1/StrS aminotransferase family protein [Sansalvadorimonas sp. 2012CJ34-2]|uniref:DegT/DnrJ/EryC1/StrS aminotransferase family protein n=1 Tax=Parendozoicomonas callyspongiae TaxID=2942213 RepID=A0ABT0PKX7_9GAMM|nr:DegT/DnrJ/EryC1/StrS aminotransferase family protein [Sansalvadorimonas sp. 2012CJ34-2]MCL6272049.1 DegT/DnrJ/EryC1/StrS aminotransferase family protein [Sansalvadorimonas sp. 2012CJ34-2]
MLNTSLSPWPSYTEEEANAVRSVLLSNKVNYWTGSESREFENEFAKWCGSEYAVAVGNGTLALDIALKALDVKCGDEVIVTSRTFLASVSCIVNAGATPVFADVDRDTQNITAETIKKVITPKSKAIICVHLAGWPCEMDDINLLAKEHNLFVIEDCAQAHGAKYKGQRVGSLGDIGAWSFCQDKIMTTGGEGGMVTTNNKELWNKMWSYKDHGKSYDAVYNREHPQGYRWLHESFGTNWRITEMQSAIGRIQLKRMSDWTNKRAENSDILGEVCRSIPALRVPVPPNHIEHAWYKYYAFVRPHFLNDGWTRARIIDEINSRGIPCFQGSCSEVYLEKAFDGSGLRPDEPLPVAKELGETSLMFLVHPTLLESEIKKTAAVIKEVMSIAS